ncbi:unnamed protein product [Blepharisma stoltei]|uniref:Uncharacterized protein n=1 Tax=Blepharisma stoltei TaxID=1481888 RepID=A0AAU9JV33_9CILI|nr:unnamed protein product [Blepharisma stoltei]
MKQDISLHEELRGTYEKTLQLAVSITQSKADLFSSKVRGNDAKFVKSVAREFHDFKTIHDDYLKSNSNSIKVDPIENPSKSESPISRRHKFMYSKYAGKLKLNTSVDEAHAMVALAKAGNISPIVSSAKESDKPSPILKKLKFNHSLLLQNEKSSTKLPYVSLLSGKTKPPLDLPSYKEYLKCYKTYNKKQPKETPFQKIDRCQQILENLQKEISGLEIFYNENPGIPWNNDKKFLLKLNNSPSRRNAMIKAYNDKIAGTAKNITQNSRLKRFITKKVPKTPSMSPEKFNEFYHENSKTASVRQKMSSPVFSISFEKTSETNPLIEDPKDVLQRCSERFKLAEDSENKKLIEILQKLKVERPLILKKKARLILDDNEKYRDRVYSLNKFEEYKRTVEFERFSAMKKNKSQASIYNSLLSYLKKRERIPSEIELSLMDILKEYLESGNVISFQTIKEILNDLSFKEKISLKPLLSIAQSFLEISDEEFDILFIE